MKPIQKAILNFIDMREVSSLLDYFHLLKKTFSTHEIVNDILEVSYSTFYNFNTQAKRGRLVDGVMRQRLTKLYTYSKTGIWSETE
jgi:predicted nucleotidyltransferase